MFILFYFIYFGEYIFQPYFIDDSLQLFSRDDTITTKQLYQLCVDYSFFHQLFQSFDVEFDML